jgi:amino acid adenylation domain-containing protein/thioester reductase-like protein
LHRLGDFTAPLSALGRKITVNPTTDRILGAIFAAFVIDPNGRNLEAGFSKKLISVIIKRCVCSKALSSQKGLVNMNLSNLSQFLKIQAEKAPDSIAIVDGSTSITYHELDSVTDSLAAYLQHQGVTGNKLVGIFMEKSTDYVIACFAALKAGGAYMPLQLEYPDSMLSKIIVQDQPTVIITKSYHSSRLESNAATVIIDIDSSKDWKNYNSNLKPVSLASSVDNRAMIIYTSGSTGEPKGVLLSHRAMIYSYYRHLCEVTFNIAGERSAHNSFFALEMLKPFLRGATCYIIPNEVAYDPKLFLNFIATYKITETVVTPSFLRLLLNRVEPIAIQDLLSSLKVLWILGEVLTTDIKDRILQIFPSHIHLLNWYGMTEFPSISLYELERGDNFTSEFCPVGLPLEEVRVYLLDENKRIIPDGNPGELYVSGPCSADGYLNRPELTKEKFLVLDNDRFYRTGDIATLLPNGMLVVHGRCDSTVKIRGYNINLKTVESALQKTGLVKSCFVTTLGKEGEDKQLIAYVVKQMNTDLTLNSVEIQRELRSYLPDYMIPRLYVSLTEIPLSPNGKVDQKILPLPLLPDKIDLTSFQIRELTSPRSQEEIVENLLENILFLEQGQIDRNSNFFDFGLDSLMSVELAILIEQIFKVELTAIDVYSYPTIDKLLKYINNKDKRSSSTVSLMQKDSYLDPDIVIPLYRKSLTVKDAKTVFITGTTGFLGGFLLDELLRSTDDDVKFYCLVRTRSGLSDVGKQKIVNNLKQYGLWNQKIEKQIIPIVGDLSQEYLGLPIEQFRECAEKIDHIFHCAAPVNFLGSYDILKAPIVNGTREIIRLAFTHAIKPLQYISTVAIFPPKGIESKVSSENSNIDSFANELGGGYAQAKWVAEKLVWRAIDRGLPACIYRPSYIGHHSMTGAYNPRDFQFLVIDACKKVQCAPETDQVFFEMTPVDFFVRSIVHFADDEWNFGQAYNVTEPRRMPAKEVFELLKERGYISNYVSVDKWKAKVVEKAQKDGDAILSVVSQFFEENMERYPNVYSSSLFKETLSKYQIEEPIVDSDYIKIAKFLNT